MKKRVLLDNGKFADFKGKRELAKVKPEATKIAERKDAEAIGNKHGFDVSNPEVEGTLSEKDIELLKGEISLAAVISLANNRKIDLPENLEAKEDIILFLLGKGGEEGPVTLPSEGELSLDQKNAIKKMSIPEMRAWAKENEVKIPGTKKKADDIRDFLINGDSPEDEL